MFGRSFRRQRVGQAISARAINAPAAEAARGARLRIGPGMAQTLMAGIPLLRGRAAGCSSFWATLTSNMTFGEYHFTRLAESGSVLVATATSGVAFDVNRNATIVCPVVVRMFLDVGSGTYRFQYHFC